MDVWILSLIISYVVLFMSILMAVFPGRTSRSKFGLTALNVMITGVFFSSLIMFAAVAYQSFQGLPLTFIKVVLFAFYNSLAVFFMANPIELVTETVIGFNPILNTLFVILAGLLYTVAPVLTLGFILASFSEFFQYCKLAAGYKKDLYVFSELNERSLAIAGRLRGKGLIIIAAGSSEKCKSRPELAESAKDMHAVTFDKSIQEINLKYHSNNSRLSFFVVNDDDTDGTRAVLWISGKYGQRDNTRLTFFSDKPETEVVLNSINKGKMVVRRINEPQALIYRALYEKSIFETPSKNPPAADGNRRICIVVVGMDKHGAEMVKGAAWCGQMDGFELEIHVFEQDKSVIGKFRASCPELLDEEHNGRQIEGGEAKYTITFHSDTEAGTKEFVNEIRNIPQATLLFVSLGSDSANIETAVLLRSLYERMGSKPDIQAVVYDNSKADMLLMAQNFKGQQYSIDFIGDLYSMFSDEGVFSSELEQKALALHKKWGSSEDFYAYEYYYRSSMASAIHAKLRKECRIPGINKPSVSELTEDEVAAISILEHKRWNAYMRSEGYVFSGSLDKASRNDMGKTHHNLVPFAMLNEKDKKKDIEICFEESLNKGEKKAS